MSYTIDIRNDAEMVSQISQNSRFSFEFYNGSPEDYEDIADYYTQGPALNTLKGVRVG